jgi:hypothetical protein
MTTIPEDIAAISYIASRMEHPATCRLCKTDDPCAFHRPFFVQARNYLAERVRQQAEAFRIASIARLRPQARNRAIQNGGDPDFAEDLAAAMWHPDVSHEVILIAVAGEYRGKA